MVQGQLPVAAVSPVVNSTHAYLIQVKVAASVEINEEVPIDEFAVSDGFALSGNATPLRDEYARWISQMEAAAKESELNDL